MNTKIVRNFSIMALMLGAMFLLPGKQAKAQSESCQEQCGVQMEQCIITYCQDVYLCGGGQGATYCDAQLSECMASCS